MDPQPAPAVEPFAPFVPALCPGGTVAIIGGGPSVTAAQVERIRKARLGGAVDVVIAINRSYRVAPWADVLYGCDSDFWARDSGVPTFLGLKFALERGAGVWPGVAVLKNTGVEGLEMDPSGLRNGRNSGYQAINAAAHMGAIRVLLVGYDCNASHGRRHHYPDAGWPTQLPFRQWLAHWDSIKEPLGHLGIEVLNCSPGSALRTFPRRLLNEVLP